MKEVELKPGWLARDVARAVDRVNEWSIVPCDCRDPDTIVESDHHPIEPLWTVRCRTCGWRVSSEATKAEAISVWNKSHSD